MINCACGKPLHYTSEDAKEMVTRLVERFGECVNVTVGAITYKVQRHYIALHGLSAQELPQLAIELGFEHD